jgi:hypothetical protein
LLLDTSSKGKINMFLIVNEEAELGLNLLISLAGVSVLVAIFAINAYILYTLKRIKTYIKKRGEK